MKNLWRCGFGTFWAAGHTQVGPRSVSARKQETEKAIFGPRMAVQGSVLRPKRDPKSVKKSLPEKVSKNDAKWTKNEAKMAPKSTIFRTFSKKAKSHEMLCFTIENCGLGMSKTWKIYQKSMQNRCWKKVCKNDKKWSQNGVQNRGKIRRPLVGRVRPCIGGGLPPPTPSALGTSPPKSASNSSIHTL